MQEFKDLAEKVKTQLKLEYDSDSVKYLEEFIERQRTLFPEDQLGGLINSCGAFLGQCIIENYGGKWIRDDSGQAAIAFDDKNIVYPFAKVSKQFANGLEDSVYSMYTILPTVFKLPPKTKKKWWQF